VAVNGASSAEVERKKSKFREFLKLMGKSAGTSKEKQSWNDQFENFMIGKDEVKTFKAL
jgi:hypothetical protein